MNEVTTLEDVQSLSDVHDAAWNCRADTVATRACRAALAYDIAIQEAARHGQSWTGGEDLDALYVAWIRLSREALGDQQATAAPGDGLSACDISEQELAEDENRILEGEPASGEPVGFLTRPAPAAEGRSDRNTGAMCGTCVSRLKPVSEGYPCDGCGSEGDEPGFDS